MSLELKLSSDEKTDKFFFDESLFENYCYVPAVFLGSPNSLQMVTAAMKLKDAYSLEEKLCPT